MTGASGAFRGLPGPSRRPFPAPGPQGRHVRPSRFSGSPRLRRFLGPPSAPRGGPAGCPVRGPSAWICTFFSCSQSWGSVFWEEDRKAKCHLTLPIKATCCQRDPSPGLRLRKPLSGLSTVPPAPVPTAVHLRAGPPQNRLGVLLPRRVVRRSSISRLTTFIPYLESQANTASGLVGGCARPPSADGLSVAAEVAHKVPSLRLARL